MTKAMAKRLSSDAKLSALMFFIKPAESRKVVVVARVSEWR
jgi:hypothetical protein